MAHNGKRNLNEAQVKKVKIEDTWFYFVFAQKNSYSYDNYLFWHFFNKIWCDVLEQWSLTREGVIIKWPLKGLFQERRDVIVTSRTVVFTFFANDGRYLKRRNFDNGVGKSRLQVVINGWPLFSFWNNGDEKTSRL